MDHVTARELTAALTSASPRPRARRALLERVREAAPPETAGLVRAWAMPEGGTGGGNPVEELAEVLAREAALRPSLARELRGWLLAEADEAAVAGGHRVDNAIGASARIGGPVVQAHDIHGGIHIHSPSAPHSAADRAVPRQLPPVPAHFTNRSRELAGLDRLARNVGHGPVLAVISGPAGVGKTTLARRWLLGLADAFPDGQLYADLRGHSGGGPARPTELLGELLRALGHEQVPVELNEQAALWRSTTAGARIAVLLDNAVSAAQVRPLLPGAAGALTAVTSRARLTGLGMDGAAFHPLGVLATGDAVELLRSRIGADRVGREPEAALAMAKACAGLPLAVCVAGARVAARPRQPLAVMAGALGGDPGGTLDALWVEGEYAVRGALDASYRLLGPDLARCYRRLGLAPVPVFGVPIAAAVCEVPPVVAERLLDELAEVNLIEDLGPDSRTGQGRYRFHDLVRAHASQVAEETETPAAAEATVRRVVDFCLSAATAAEALLTPGHRTLRRAYEHPVGQPPPFADAPSALRWLDAERAHLMAVLRTAAERGWDASTWMLADALWPLFLRLRPYDLWIEAHETGLAAARRAGDREGLGRMLTSGGTGLRNIGRHDEAAAWFGEALDLARQEVARLAEGQEAEDPGRPAAARKAEAQALHGLGQTYRLAERLTDATRYFHLALALREEIGYRRGAALTRLCLGDVALAAHRPEDALPHLTRARADLLAEDDPYDAARALAFLGRAHARCDGADFERAEGQLTQALAEFEATGSVHWQGRVLEMLGEGAAERGDQSRAREWYGASLARYAAVSAADARRLEERLSALG
ncbi:ATP-binding protein [Streptomyces sp. NPDC055243]|uniref:ATP-binding protein n=1 Tax=Streptomyces sp. NPDC055243 TaxID=3365720 RepID=UPI0037D54485